MDGKVEIDPARMALSALINASGESCAALSRMLGRNPAYVQQYLKRGSPRRLPETDRAMLARFFGVAEAQLGGPQSGATMIAVPAPDVGAAAGAGSLLSDEASMARRWFDPALLRALGVRAEAASVIRVQGDSMAPTLLDGDEILVDTDATRISSQGGMFVIRLDGMILVKRVVCDADGVMVYSDNPDWPPVGPVPVDAVVPLGRVAWLARVPR